MNKAVTPKSKTHRKRIAVLGMSLSITTFVFAAFQGSSIPPGTTRFNLIPPRGIPMPPLTADNPLTIEGVALGDRLFNEVKLSDNNSISCASCHHEDAALSDPGKAVSLGAEGQIGVRNAPALTNVAFAAPFFLDGRTPTLRSQTVQPIQNSIEMHQTLAAALGKLQADATYVAAFKKAFGSAGITEDRLKKALEQYLEQSLSGNTPFDRFQAGQTSALTASQQRGRTIFFTPVGGRVRGGDCFRCHGGPTFSDHNFHNVGLDLFSSDKGRGGVTNNPRDIGAFKTPSLRNIAVTGPFMHDGRFRTIRDVVDFYSEGIRKSSTLDPGLAKLNGGFHFTAQEKSDLVAFLESLTDPKYQPRTP